MVTAPAESRRIAVKTKLAAEEKLAVKTKLAALETTPVVETLGVPSQQHPAALARKTAPAGAPELANVPAQCQHPQSAAPVALLAKTQPLPSRKTQHVLPASFLRHHEGEIALVQAIAL